MSGLGASTPATRASGSAPKTSCWAWSGSVPTIQPQTLVSPVTHAVDPQPSASAAETSIFVLIVVSWPPRRFGTMSLKRPASRIASMFSSGTRRSASVRAAFLASSGCSSVARRISSSASTPVSMTDTLSPQVRSDATRARAAGSMLDAARTASRTRLGS